MIANIGTIALSAGAIAMGMGGYLTGRSESSLYKTSRGTGLEATGQGTLEKEEVKSFLANLGIDEQLQQQAAEELTREKKDWELQMAGKQDARQSLYHPAKTGLNIGLSYALGGVIPVAPYFIIESTYDATKVSVILAVICLPVLGYLKSLVTGMNAIGGIFRYTITGLLAAAGAFFVARLFIT
jgi:VIT1/CCC1 family predicted Fe2+/Mn2+ transporter